MLTDKQSIYLCIFVILGFLISGILDVMDSFITQGILGLAFLAIIVNIFITNPFKQDFEESESNDSTHE